MRRGAPRAGIALLTTLLGVLVLEIVIAGAFHVAMQQRRIATASQRVVQLQFAARSAAAAALAEWAALEVDSIPVGGSRPVSNDSAASGIRAEVSLHRLASRLFFLRAEASFPVTGESHAVAAILRERTLEEWLAGMPAVVTARESAFEGAIEGTPPGDCAPPVGAPAERPALLLVDSAAARPFSEVAGLDLAAVAHAPPAVIVVAGDHSLETSLDESILVVHGDLEVQPGVRFRGLLLAAGSLHLQPGSELHGAVRVANRLTGADAAIRYDPCVLAALFHAHPFLRGPLRAATHWWVPSA